MTKLVLKSLTVAVLALSAVAANAADANVTNNVIMGTGGTTNGNYTIGTGNNIEIGLRARERHDLVNNLPTNVSGTNNNGSYNQNAGEPPGFGGVGQNRARWNFDWSINTDQSGQGGVNVNAYTYLLSMDFDPGVGTNFQTFNPINGTTTCADHSFGNNLTLQSAGDEVVGNIGPVIGNNKCGPLNVAADSIQYTTLLAGNNLVQNSWNYDFFDSVFFFDPNAQGTYTIKLEAFGLAGGAALASSLITVNVGASSVPEPGSMALVGLALAGLAVMRRRRKV